MTLHQPRPTNQYQCHSKLSLRLSPSTPNSTVSIQYTFDSSNRFPHPFLSPRPRFTTAVDPKLRSLPCILILHDTWPGGFDVARWYAGGLSLAAMDATVQKVLTCSHPPATSHSSSLLAAASSLRSTYRPLPALPPLGLLGLSRPGFHRSSPLLDHTFASEASLLGRFLDLLCLNEVFLFAVGTGAQTALHLADQRPSIVQSLVLVDPILTRPSSPQLWGMRLQAELYHRQVWSTWLAYQQYAQASTSLPSRGFFHRHHAAELEPLEAAVISSAWYHEERRRRLDGLVHHQGVLFAQGQRRYPGIRSDILKLQHLPGHLEWSRMERPILCLDTQQPGLLRQEVPDQKELDSLFPNAKVASKKVQCECTKAQIQNVAKAAIEFFL
ncbi:hypothetical protein IWQ62_005388 [Dispira parvispora]|uniref:Uncharacterized protein n=1 Tax=Dispira parvispora TaxID=1520584 RepID=A0A9W8AQJ1_9FUNG|nr:hypothetical protein IWQ62_005388 [Dispira parvispora]